jgi:hypothetical protein
MTKELGLRNPSILSLGNCRNAIKTGGLEITETFDQSAIKKASLVVRFSILGLSPNGCAGIKMDIKEQPESVFEAFDSLSAIHCMAEDGIFRPSALLSLRGHQIID